MAIFVPKDRKSLFRQFLSGMYDAVVITDPNGHIIEINPRATEHFGLQPDEVVDRPIDCLIPGLQPDVVRRIRKGLEEDRHIVIDANGCTKDNQKIACEVTVTVIDLMNPGDLVFTIRNVERRRRLMGALRSRSNAFALSPTPLFACSPDGHFTECNPAFLEMFGLDSEEDARQRVFCDLMNDEPLPDRFKRALDGEESITGIVAEGESSEEELEIALKPDVHGRKTVGVVGSVRKVGSCA